MAKDRKSLFRLFGGKEGKGVEPGDVITTSDWKGFFYRYKLCFGKLLYVNILYVIGNVFLLFLILTWAGYTKETFFAPLSETFLMQNSIYSSAGTSSSTLSLMTLLGQQTSHSANTAWTFVFWGLGGLTLFTFGIVNAGCAYVLRNLVMGEPSFVFSDFWHGVKSNWKTALPVGILDAAVLFLLPYNVIVMLSSGSGYLSSVLLWMNVLLLLVYLPMRHYIYLQLVSFPLKVRKIIKNAFAMALLGWKRNACGLLGVLLLAALEGLVLLSGAGFLLPVAVALPLLLLFSHSSFYMTYATYFVIKKYMIDTADTPREVSQVHESE